MHDTKVELSHGLMSPEESKKVTKSLQFMLQVEREMMAWYRYRDSQMHDASVVNHLMRPIQEELNEVTKACEAEMEKARKILKHQGRHVNLPESDPLAPVIAHSMQKLQQNMKHVVRRVDDLIEEQVRKCPNCKNNNNFSNEQAILY